MFTYGPTVTWFAWRPVNTWTGWVWLRHVKRRKVYADIPGLNTVPVWDYAKLDDPRVTRDWR